MTGYSLWLVWMLSVWTSLWVLVMFLVPGLCRLLLRRVLLLTPVGLLVSPFLPGASLWVEVLLGFVLFGWVVLRFERLGGFMYRDSSIAPLLDLRDFFGTVG